MIKQLLFSCGLATVLNFGLTAQTSQSVLQERTVNTSKSKPQTNQFSQKAGTLLWGAGAAVGASDGEFSNPFVQATSFTSGDNPTAWTALSISESYGSVTPGNAYWTRTLTGTSAGAYSNGTLTVSSPSQANGAALFDSDFMDNGGTQGAFGTGSSPSAQKGELISPRIDLTGYTDTALAISLYTVYRNFQITELSVSFSIDDGLTWFSTVDYRQFITDQTAGQVNINFPNVTAGVTNLTQCRIKLTFDGDYYFAVVDDISIKTTSSYDMALGVADPTGNTLIEAADFIHLTSNRYFPISQLTYDNRHFAFGGNIRNLGALDILPPTNPKLILTIEKDVSGTWTEVFADTIVTDTVPAGGYISVSDLISDNSWVEVGDYRATYTGEFDENDGDLDNNTLEHFFTITSNNYASKVSLDINDSPYATRAIFPGGGPFESFEYGSVFYFNEATSANLMTDSISFKYYLTNNFSSVNVGEDQTLYANIYSVDPSTGILDDPALLTQIGIGVISLNGLGTTVLPGEYGTAVCSNLIDASTGMAMPPLTTGHYYISITINPSLSGGPATFTANDVPWFGASEEKNYNYNLTLTTTDSLINVSPLTVTDASSTTATYWTGFGGDIVPSIGVYLSGDFCTVNAITVQPLDQTANAGNNAIFTFTDVLNSPTYQWQLDEGTGFTDLSNGGQYSGVNTNTLTVSSVTMVNNNDSFRCLVTESANCEDTTSAAILTVEDDASLTEWNSSDVILYPNPTNGKVTAVFAENTTGTIRITNILGEEVFNTSISATTMELDLQSLNAQGVYLVHIVDQIGNVLGVHKLIYK
ncbi:MAG: hypothetical protein COA32_11135 [Fluviicola sp.]|nr:MAG: hypothetical protein COA32_11135 [Fluviicola sp.]